MWRKLFTVILSLFGAVGLILWAQNYIQTNPSIVQAVAGYLTIQDEGSSLAQQNTLNFIGSGITCVNNSGGAKTDCTIPGGGVSPSGFYLNSGSNYYIGPTFQLATLPVLGSFSFLTTQGSASAATSNNAVVMTSPSTAGDHLRCFGVSIGSNSTLTTALSFQVKPTDFAFTGIGFRESGTGKAETMGPYYITQNTSPAFGQLSILKWTSESNPTTFLYQSPNLFNADMRWYQLVYATGSPGTITYNYSNDGVNFATVYTENANSFFTTAPDQWCLFSDPNNSGGSYTMTTTLYSWNAVP